MTAKLILLLRGEPFQEMTLEIPDFRKMPFPRRVDLRQEFVRQRTLELKAIYYRQIDKVQGNYQIILVIPGQEVGISKIESELLKQAV